jgi:hypothetical protein
MNQEMHYNFNMIGISKVLLKALFVCAAFLLSGAAPSHAVLVTFDSLTTTSTYTDQGVEFVAWTGTTFGPKPVPVFDDPPGLGGSTRGGWEVEVNLPESDVAEIVFDFAVTTVANTPGGNVYVSLFDQEGFLISSKRVNAEETGNDKIHAGYFQIEIDLRNTSPRKLKRATLDFESAGGSQYVLDDFGYVYTPAVMPGDVDNSGTVDLSDAVLCLRVISERAGGFLVDVRADVNLDGRIGKEDASYILQKVSESR